MLITAGPIASNPVAGASLMAKFNPVGKKMNCRRVPSAYAAFDAHSSPLGLEYFDAGNGAQLKNSFLVALHGSTKRSLNRGYRVVRISGTPARSIVPEDFISGFLERKVVHGRPVDVLGFGTDAFLLTDDYAGVVYYVYRGDAFASLRERAKSRRTPSS